MDQKTSTILTIAIGIVGLMLPVIFWYADSETRSIEVNVVSRVNLDPSVPEGLGGEVAVTLDGSRVAHPHFSVVEITNAGNRAISSADVERPIVLSVGRAKLVRAQVMKSTPVSLAPKIQMLDDGVLISPLLLNPGDKLQVGMLTSGKDVSLSASARISGVKDINLLDPTASKESRTYWLNAMSALLLLPIYSALLFQGFGRWIYPFKGLRIRSIMLIPMALVCMVASASLAVQTYLPFGEGWRARIAALVVGLTAMLIGRLVMTKNGDRAG